jgi:hypothetical protein
MAFKDTQFWKAIVVAWKWLLNLTQFLDGPMVNGVSKFSSKLLIALSFAVVCIRQFIIGDWFGGLLLGAGSIILAIVSAITKT